MVTPNPDPWITILAGSKTDGTAITVRDYSTMHGGKDRVKIADLIRLRFTERYLNPALDNPNRHHDALEFPDGQLVLLTQLDPGQYATVLQLPAVPLHEAQPEAAEPTVSRVEDLLIR